MIVLKDGDLLDEIMDDALLEEVVEIDFPHV